MPAICMAGKRPPYVAKDARVRSFIYDYPANVRLETHHSLPRPSAALPSAESGPGGGVEIEGGAEFAARVLLDRYGVVFRRLCTREPWLPPWRELVAVYRRREARGEMRRGRFLALATGEQFALPEAVGLCVTFAVAPHSLELVSLSGANPLNLAGIVTPRAMVPRGSGRVLYLDGVPIASQTGREIHMSEDLDRGAAWEARKALLRRGVGASRLPGGRRRDDHPVGVQRAHTAMEWAAARRSSFRRDGTGGLPRGRGPAQGPQSRCTRADLPLGEPPNLRPLRHKQYQLQNRVEIPMLIQPSNPTPKALSRWNRSVGIRALGSAS